MENAQWQVAFANNRKTTEFDKDGLETGIKNAGKTPDITKRLLEMDEQQLDLLTGQRNAIFKGKESRNTVNVGAAEGNLVEQKVAVTLTGAANALKEGNT